MAAYAKEEEEDMTQQTNEEKELMAKVRLSPAGLYTPIVNKKTKKITDYQTSPSVIPQKYQDRSKYIPKDS